MTVKLFSNRVAAINAAESECVSRGYSKEQAAKYCTAFQVRKFGASADQWEAWAIHHIANGVAYRRPVMDCASEPIAAIEPGFGHHGAIRIGEYQAVRPRHAETFDIFRNGACIETGMTETQAREFMINKGIKS